MDLGHLVGGGEGAIAALLGCEIDDDRTGFHRLHHFLGDQHRRLTAGDQGGGDDDILLLDMFGNQRRLLGLIFLRHLFRIPARGLGLREFVIHHGDEGAAQRFHLFLGGGTNVCCRHNGAQALGGGDGLQARNAHAHNEDTGGRDGACRRHHHRHGAAELGGGIDYGLVACEIGLAGQHVHRLGAADARQHFHCEGGNACIGERGDGFFLGEGRKKRGIDRALLHRGDFIGLGPAHLEDDIGIRKRRSGIGRKGGARRLIIRIRDLGACARAAFDSDIEPKCFELLHRFRRGGNTRFTGAAFLEDGKFHGKGLMRAENGEERHDDKDTDQRPFGEHGETRPRLLVRADIHVARLIILMVAGHDESPQKRAGL